MILEEPSDFVKFMNQLNNHYSYEFIHMIDDILKTGVYPENLSKKERKDINTIIEIYKESTK